ncbi:mediator of DNA damage checkpoint protein 1-like isoform X3 [Maniola jurtina]|uniref:mediator of DNA damage checkpoint protein 1-like isoform X3 n=1 Tax=Maniola jurtina TaxID=191418 RepID=UPI001E68CAD9|nr:mediator of DNA damage checkpoint protein 1-like isoform X3 [Maniola jurtina]
MSDEMAVGDKGPSEENKVGGEDAEMETTDSVASSEPPIETTGAEPQQSAPVEVPLPPDAEDDPPETIAAIREELGIKDDNLPKSDNVVKTDTDTKHKIEMVHEITVEHKSDEEVQDNDIYTDDVFKQDNDVKAILEDEGQSIVRVENTKIDEDKILASEGKVTKEVDVQLEKDDQDDITPTIEASRGMKRRASAAFSDDGMEEFKGFDNCEPSSLADYSRIVERLEAEVSAAVKTYKPLKTVMAAPTPRASKRARQDMGRAKWSGPLEEEVSAFVKSFLDDGVKAGKRQRQGTDSSRPSSALSSRSDDAAMNPDGSSAGRTARRATAAPEMSSPLLRVPLERGWKRELVYRAAQASTDPPRRNADIYYYTPQGKKLRSTREVSEHLSGTGLTIENFSFFKEPLGLDDPDKEIIRDAKINRRVESPVPAATPPAVEGKRTPKPKPPKGASPEPTTPKSPPAKIKVKSMGSRLSSNGTTPKTTKKPQPQTQQAQPQPATTPADNNNTAAWKKPSPPVRVLSAAAQVTLWSGRGPPPLQPRPAPPPAPQPATTRDHHQVTNTTILLNRQVQQPCSLTCGRGVPTLACAACLCLYHPPCVGFVCIPPPDRFMCKNCRKSSSPPLEPPPLIHKSGVATNVHHPQVPSIPANISPNIPANISPNIPANMSANISASTSTPRRLPVPVPVPVPAKVPKSDKRVLLRMKVAGGGPDGERVWAVAKPSTPITPTPNTPAPAPAPSLPQSLAILNGRREGVKTLRSRIANGAASPPAPLQSPRRRGRPKVDDTDHFTAFHSKAQEHNYNIAVQIFQYLGMRDLARSARVCKLWQTLAAAPALWRHVRMKNSHVSDWAGLCAALKRHGTRWLDLRKMLLPPNDALFWDHFAQHIGAVDTLERLELCRCPARAVQAACERLPGLRALAAPAIRDARLDPSPLALLPRLELLRLKSLAGLSLTRDLRPLAALTRLQHLSLTSIKELGWCACEVVGQLEQLESLELGECSFGGSFAAALGKLVKLRRLRLERGVAHCAAPALLRALSALPKLTRLELVNFDVKVGFDDALAECKNIQRLLIIPTYVSQSATTNKQVLSGVLRLKETLTHLMWGVTIELLRVTELFIDQCEAGEGESKRRDVGECIPVLKPVPGCRLPDDHRTVAGPPQVEILPIPTLQRLLSAQLPNTKLKLLRIPFHATWRQSLADFQ